jgi:hypothetical protein
MNPNAVKIFTTLIRRGAKITSPPEYFNQAPDGHTEPGVYAQIEGPGGIPVWSRLGRSYEDAASAADTLPVSAGIVGTLPAGVAAPSTMRTLATLGAAFGLPLLTSAVAQGLEENGHTGKAALLRVATTGLGVVGAFRADGAAKQVASALVGASGAHVGSRYVSPLAAALLPEKKASEAQREAAEQRERADAAEARLRAQAEDAEGRDLAKLDAQVRDTAPAEASSEASVEELEKRLEEARARRVEAQRRARLLAEIEEEERAAVAVPVLAS